MDAPWTWVVRSTSSCTPSASSCPHPPAHVPHPPSDHSPLAHPGCSSHPRAPDQLHAHPQAQMSWGLQAGETAQHPPPPALRCDLAQAVKWSARLLIAVMALGESTQTRLIRCEPRGLCGDPYRLPPCTEQTQAPLQDSGLGCQADGGLPGPSTSQLGAEGPHSRTHSFICSFVQSVSQSVSQPALAGAAVSPALCRELCVH